MMLLHHGILIGAEMKLSGEINLFLETADLLLNRMFMAQSLPGALPQSEVMDQAFIG